MSNVNGVFDAPIPGQSLTNPPGTDRFKQPPQFVHLDDALNFVWDRLHRPKTLLKLIGLLKSGAPVQSLTSTLIFRGVSEGNWTVDLGMLMYQTVLWQIEAIAKLKKIKIQTFNDDRQHRNDMIAISNIVDNNKVKNQTLEDSESPTAQLKSGDTNKQFKGFF